MSDIHDYEQHFNGVQMKLRSIASTWMLASLGGIAFLLVNEIKVDLVFNRYNLINAISAMTVIAMFILWLIDQMAYQRLLNSCLVVDLYGEYKDKSKPPLKAMMAIAAGTGMTKFYNWFYFLPMMFFTVFSAVAFYLNVAQTGQRHDAFWTNAFFGGFFLSVNIVIWLFALRKRKDVPYMTLAEAFTQRESGEIDDEFIRVMNNKNNELQILIARYEPKTATK